jgi:hypothetical protein
MTIFEKSRELAQPLLGLIVDRPWRQPYTVVARAFRGLGATLEKQQGKSLHHHQQHPIRSVCKYCRLFSSLLLQLSPKCIILFKYLILFSLKRDFICHFCSHLKDGGDTFPLNNSTFIFAFHLPVILLLLILS